MNKIKFNKNLILIILSFVITIGIILFGVFGDNTMKLSYEIDLNKSNKIINYNVIDDSIGIQCGSVKVLLGQKLDISTYKVENELIEDNIYIKQLLSPSKKYEVVVINSGDGWYVQEIRTTIPGVYNLSGYKIGDTKNEVKSFIKIRNKNKLTYKSSDNTETSIQFVDDCLCVIYLRVYNNRA